MRHTTSRFCMTRILSYNVALYNVLGRPGTPDVVGRPRASCNATSYNVRRASHSLDATSCNVPGASRDATSCNVPGASLDATFYNVPGMSRAFYD